LKLPEDTPVHKVFPPQGDKFLGRFLPKFKKVLSISDAAQRDEALRNRSGLDLVAFSCLVYKDPHFLNSTELEFDCRGSIKMVDDQIEITVGEIKSTADADVLRHGFEQLLIRLKILEEAAKILFPNKRVSLAGILFIGPPLPEEYSMPNMDSEMEKFSSSTLVEFSIIDDLF
jgi:hypothetical protein